MTRRCERRGTSSATGSSPPATSRSRTRTPPTRRSAPTRSGTSPRTSARRSTLPSKPRTRGIRPSIRSAPRAANSAVTTPTSCTSRPGSTAPPSTASPATRAPPASSTSRFRDPARRRTCTTGRTTPTCTSPSATRRRRTFSAAIWSPSLTGPSSCTSVVRSAGRTGSRRRRGRGSSSSGRASTPGMRSPAQLTIERVDMDRPRPLPSPEDVVESMRWAGDFLTGAMLRVARSRATDRRAVRRGRRQRLPCEPVRCRGRGAGCTTRPLHCHHAMEAGPR